MCFARMQLASFITAPTAYVYTQAEPTTQGLLHETHLEALHARLLCWRVEQHGVAPQRLLVGLKQVEVQVLGDAAVRPHGSLHQNWLVVRFKAELDLTRNVAGVPCEASTAMSM